MTAMTREHARLFLLSALHGAELAGRGSALSLAEWESLLSMLPPDGVVDGERPDWL